MYKRRKPSNGSLVGKAACASTTNIRDYIANVTEETIATSPAPRDDDAELDKENIDTSTRARGAAPTRTQSNIINSSTRACGATPTRTQLNATNAATQLIDFNDVHGLFKLCGLDVNAVPSNILNLDQAVFVRKLSSKLFSGRGKSNDNVVKFMNSLKKFFSDNDEFLKSLSPTSTAPDCDVARGSTQDSLVRLLLQIEEIQTELANYLLDKLAELGLQTEVDFYSEMTAVAPITWVKLILQSFRYLNCIVNSKNLCERLFDIIFSSPDRQIQQEVVIYLPDIIGDTEHHFAANELSKLLKSELELMPPVLDALTNLSVQSEIRKEVRRDLIDTLRSSPIEFLPNIVKFLLSTCDADSYEEILNGLRKELLADDSVSLKNTMTEEHIDVDGIKVLIFSNIRNCLLANKQLAENWLKNISQLNREIKCRPLDLFVTLMLHDICTESSKKRNIETIIRGRIKNETFSVALIDKTFEHHVPVIIEYFKPLMSILSKLLKSVDGCITEFVTAFYLSCFKSTDRQWCQMIITELLAYIGAGDTNDAQTALSILSTIAVKYPNKIRPTAPILSVLLNKLTSLPLREVSQLMDMLCFIAFSETDDNIDINSLKSEITSLIEKQFSSSNIKLLRVGIIAAVMTIKHIAMVTDDETNLFPDKSSDDFDDNNLSDRARRALPFLKLIIDGTKIIPEALGFAFDQFSLMLKKNKNLDKSLLFYTSLIMKENMKKYFLICNDELKSLDFIECAVKFNLNEDEEEYVVLNLTPTLVEELNCRVRLRMFVLVLPSLLRLIRELEFEDLREIDGLLECPIVVPSPKVFEEFGLQSPEVQCVAMDSLFYAMNWFREIVNCFARMIKQPTGMKVLIRLRTLIWLQKLISQYLPQMLKNDYCPPKCHFHKSIKAPTGGSEKKKKKPAAKKKKSDTKTTDIRKHLVRGDSTIAGTPTTQFPAQDESDGDIKENKDKTADMKNYKQFFRELDWDVWVMLSLPLTLEPEPEKDWELKPDFGPSELLFVMEDLIDKIQFVLISSAKKTPFGRPQNEDVGLTSSSLYVDVPILFVKNLVKLSTRLCTHLEALAQYCHSLLEKNDNIIDATGMFVPETVEIKTAFSLILKSFSILFNWPGFNDGNNQDLFVTALSRINARVESDVRSNSVISLIKSCVNYFAKFQEMVLHFDCALNLVAVIDILNKHAEKTQGEKCSDINKILGKMCWNFLSHHWYDWNGCEEKGPNFNRGIEHLLTTYFSCAHQKIKAIQLMSEWLREEVTHLNNKDSSLTTLPNINKANCNIVLRVMLKTLTIATKETIDGSNRPSVKLELWIKVMRVMESVVAILKIQSLRTNLLCFVKGSSPVLRLFLSNGLSVCSTLFRSESTQVSQLLKTSQITTRYLQKIFDNTKLTEDSTMCANLPTVRSLLESILLKVKEIMVQNKCTEAFFVGSMRNKDIQGQDILSQSTINEDSDRMDVDADIPDNDDDDNKSIEVEDDISNNDEENVNNEEDEGNESEEIVHDEDEGEEEDRKRKTPKNRRS